MTTALVDGQYLPVKLGKDPGKSLSLPTGGPAFSILPGPISARWSSSSSSSVRKVNAYSVGTVVSLAMTDRAEHLPIVPFDFNSHSAGKPGRDYHLQETQGVPTLRQIPTADAPTTEMEPADKVAFFRIELERRYSGIKCGYPSPQEIVRPSDKATVERRKPPPTTRSGIAQLRKITRAATLRAAHADLT